jgi:MraZ protein
VTRFFGRFEHTIDDKGRLTLPAKFRAAFEKGGYLTQGLDGCLALWTPEEFEAQTAAMQERAAQSQADRNLVRLWASSSADLVVDRQGRVSIPGRLRQFAGLTDDVLVLGTIDRVELWDPGRWEEKVVPEEQRLTEGTDW